MFPLTMQLVPLRSQSTLPVMYVLFHAYSHSQCFISPPLGIRKLIHCHLSSCFTPPSRRKSPLSLFLGPWFIRPALEPFLDLKSPNVFTNLLEIFDEGLRRAKGGPFLGHRPIISENPLKYADHHVWQTWPEVDARRRALGSALHKLFQDGTLGGGDLPTVGIWSKNCPST